MTVATGVTRAFDALVVVHAVVAVAAVVVLCTLRAAARAAAHSGSTLSAPAARSFTGRREVAGRIVHVVPLTGLAVVSASRGVYGIASPLVAVGLSLWAIAAVCLEASAFPAQRAVATALATSATDHAVAAARRMQGATEGALAAIVVAGIVMVAAQR